jgi:hypothetical protein
MMLQLYACGFNAWNQLRFDGSHEEEPHDIWQFKKVLKDERIDVLRADFSSTLGEYRGKCLFHHMTKAALSFVQSSDFLFFHSMRLTEFSKLSTNSNSSHNFWAKTCWHARGAYKAHEGEFNYLSELCGGRQWEDSRDPRQ